MMFAPLFCLACQFGESEISQSLVGARSLPSSEALQRETIIIARGDGTDIHTGPGQTLRHELRPDNTLVVTLVAYRMAGGEQVIAENTVELSPDVANRARQKMWRMRPEEQRGLEVETRPTGCERQFDHDFGELDIAFVAPDEKLAVFTLPSRESCRTPQAEEARNLVRQVLHSFPHTGAAAAFPGPR